MVAGTAGSDGPGYGEKQRLVVAGVVRSVLRGRGGRTPRRQHARVHARALRHRHHLHPAQRPAHLDALSVCYITITIFQ